MPPPDSTQDELPTAEETAALLSERTAPAIRPDYPSLDQPAFEQREVRVSALGVGFRSSLNLTQP